jgi:hypothetical protein
MFKTFIILRDFFKSLILRALWIYNFFCDSKHYLAFGLQLGRMDFPHLSQLQSHLDAKSSGVVQLGLTYYSHHSSQKKFPTNKKNDACVKSSSPQKTS